MKALFVPVIAVFALIGCYTSREVQVEIIDAQLVKIDTIVRYQKMQQQLTWQTSDRMEYVSYASINGQYVVGTRMSIFRPR